MPDTLKEKLVALGVHEKFPNLAQSYGEVIPKVSGVEELEHEFREGHFTCDVEQYILPAFRMLYQQDEQVRERVRREL